MKNKFKPGFRKPGSYSHGGACVEYKMMIDERNTTPKQYVSLESLNANVVEMSLSGHIRMKGKDIFLIEHSKGP
ncbi:hypothetical protein YC2023_104589 [Brassica napus]